MVLRAYSTSVIEISLAYYHRHRRRTQPQIYIVIRNAENV